MNSTWKVEISDGFKQELSGKVGVPENDIDDCFNDPDSTDSLLYKGLHLKFMLKKFPQMPRAYFVLGYGQYTDNTVHVSMVWKLYPWDDNDPELLEPIVILGNFAQDFGLPVLIGKKRKQFFIKETITLQNPSPDGIIQIENPDHQEYVQQIYTRHEQQDEKLIIDCALGLCIDMDKYRLKMMTR